MRYKDMKLGAEDIVLKTERNWLYHVDKDGYISRGKMGMLVSVNPEKYALPEKYCELVFHAKGLFIQ